MQLVSPLQHEDAPGGSVVSACPGCCGRCGERPKLAELRPPHGCTQRCLEGWIAQKHGKLMKILFLNACAVGSLLGQCHTGRVLPRCVPLGLLGTVLALCSGAVGFPSPLPNRCLAVLRHSPAALEVLPTNVICLGPVNPGSGTLLGQQKAFGVRAASSPRPRGWLGVARGGVTWSEVTVGRARNLFF